MKRGLLALCLLISFSLHAAETKTTLVIGMLAFEPREVVAPRWQPLISNINQKLSDIEVELRPLNYDQLAAAVARREVDFVFTNSGSYVELAHAQGLSSPLVSLINYDKGFALRGFGGVVVVRNERTDLLDLEDLRGQRIATPSKSSLGGYMMQAFELMQIGIRMPDQVRIIETDMPHDRAIKAILNDQADAAFVRTGLLESMIERNEIDARQIRVLNPQNLPSFPLHLSTRLYPEWPFAAMPHVKDQHAGQVAGALLALPYLGDAMELAGIYGFSVPADYEPVRELMRALKLPPYNIETTISWYDIWESHRLEMQLMAVALGVFMLMGLLLIFYNRRLKSSLAEIRATEESLRLAAVAFETQEAILITDKDEKIIRVNNAFTEITGYSAEEALGHTPRLLKSGMQDGDFYQQMWEDINTMGGWRGEIWNRRKDGEIYPEHQVVTAIKNPKGEVTHYLSTFSDITMRKLNEERIHNLAFFDPLTGLANRRLLEDHIEQALSSSARNLHYCALLFIDLDHFKNLNDTLGHKLGDELLKQVAIRLKECVREGDTVARPGGDEFIILLESLSTKKADAANQVQMIAEKILSRFNDPYILSESQYVLTASIGINLFIDHYESSEELMKRSDLAMYQAKAEGRNAIRFFDPSMQQAASKRSEIESDLRQAIENQEFLLYYQPKVTFNGQLYGYEALIRWQHPNKGLIPPMDFIPVAEDTGLILPIGQWVLEEASRTLRIWQADSTLKDLVLAVNISVRQFRQTDFADKLLTIINHTEINAEKLELELTESMLMDDIDDTVAKMQRLRQRGVHFALDDFGTGYSSLSYLKNLPLGCLKVDQSFVRDMLMDKDDAAIVETIITLAKALKLQVIAEGVEDAEQASALNALGCDLLQGYYYGKPAPMQLKEITLSRN